MTHNVGLVKAGTFVPGTSELAQLKQYTSTTTNTYSANTETYLVKIEEAGQYQVVFAATSDQPVVTSTSDSYYFYGFTAFTADAYPVLPAVATDLAVEADEDGALEATLTWANPSTTNVEGVALDAITKAVIIRDGEVAAEVTEGLNPGEEASFVDTKATGLTSGPHTYSVEIYNANGKSADAAPTVNVAWVGGALDITEEGITHTYAEFEQYYTFIDVHGNQKSSYDGWSISGTTAMKVDETNSDGKYDDWAISTPFNVKENGEYELTFETFIGASYRDYAPYTFELYAGNGEDTKNYVKFGEVTTTNPNSTASSFETTTIYIKGQAVEEALALLAEGAEGDETEVNRVGVAPGAVQFGFRATQKGGVSVKTFTVKKTYEPAEEPEIPAIPEDAYVVYNDGAVNSELHVYGWWNDAINFQATAPDATANVFEFKAGNLQYDWGYAGYAGASMGLNMEKPQNTGIFHEATLNIDWYAVGTGTYTVKLNAGEAHEYESPLTGDSDAWNTTAIDIASVGDGALAQYWDEDVNFGEGYIFSIILANGTEGDAIYFRSIYYTNVDESWEAPEHVIVAPETVPTPEQAPDDVISVYSSAYEPATGFNIGGWGQSTQVQPTVIDGSEVEWLRNFNYLGWELTSDLDVAEYDYLHVDFWTSTEGAGFGVTPVTRVGTPKEAVKSQTVVLNEWNRYDIALSEWAEAGLDLSTVYQLKFDLGNGCEAYLANVYFWKEAGSEEPEEPGTSTNPEDYTVTGSLSGVYEQTMGDDTVEYPYTFNYTAVYNDGKTLTITAKYDWENDQAPVGAEKFVYITAEGNGEQQTDNTFTITTATTYQPKETVNVHVKLPVALGAVENDFVITVPSLTTGIVAIEADEADVEWYNLQGIRVNEPAAGNVYIRRQGNTAVKVLVK